jgi:hypothetical protein
MSEVVTLHIQFEINKKDMSSGNYNEIPNYISHVRQDNTIRMVLIWDMRDMRDTYMKGRPDIVHFTYGVYNKLWYRYPRIFVNQTLKDPYSLT